MQHSPVLAVVVLAAGAGSRYSTTPGAKLLAEVEGEPMLARVLAAVREFGPAATVVVLGHGADRIERAIAWGDELRVRNHEPGRGLASSLQVGFDTLRALPRKFDGAFVALADQPRLSAGVMRTLAVASQDPDGRAAVVPRYSGEAARNPVLLMRSAWAWVDECDGDMGLAALLTARSDMVQVVQVRGSMPDVDTPADLTRLPQD